VYFWGLGQVVSGARRGLVGWGGFFFYGLYALPGD
jgi:hypothetical protein